ncbi:MAG: 4-hydroxythreonine-4-phosphate dehydrogenase PdxA [Thermodesulfobacteriota bacterium]
MKNRPIIGITMGDPVGVGPEIACAALAREEVYALCRPLVLGDLNVLSLAAERMKLSLSFRKAPSPDQGQYVHGQVDVAHLSDLDAGLLIAGAPSKKTGRAMVRYILTAIDWALEKKIHAVTTGPIHKGAMNAAGYHYNGHTELFAERTRTKEYVMMLAGTRLRVVLVTIHMPLCQVPTMITEEKIATVVRITEKSLRERFGIERPRLAVAALNPHAGEEGIFGDEEERVIRPAVRKIRQDGLSVSGPWPADTLFYHAVKGGFDAVVCMYHDQGLIPFKLLHFEDGVNTTLGLPIIRTSVDHGTAYDIAYTGQAQPGSLLAAIRMAAEQARIMHDLG